MHGTISLLKKLKNEDQNLVSRPWEDLPKDVMEKIGLNLNSTDYIHASVVCKSWLSLLQSDISRPQIPWILLPRQSDDHSLKFFNFLEAKYHILRLPKGLEGGYIFGSSKGWLVVVFRRRRRSGWYHVYLLNPISGVKCRLPPLPNYISLQRVEISSSNASQCNVVAIVNNSKELAFYLPENGRWKVVSISSRVGEDCSLVDILFCRRKLHILVNSLSGKGKIEDVKIKLPNYGGIIPVTLIHDLYEMLPSNVGRGISLRHRPISYLVESTEGRVMLIHKHKLNEEVSDDEEEDEEEEYFSEEEDDNNRYYSDEDDDYDDGYYSEEDDYDEDEEGYTKEEDKQEEDDYSEYSEEEEDDDDDDEYEEDDDDNESEEKEDDHSDGDEDEEFDRYVLSSLNGFRVYKMKYLGGKKRLCKKKGLGKEQAMLLSYKSRSCLHVTSNLLQGNSIYFGMGYANEDDHENSFLVNFSGICDLDYFTIQPLIPTFDYEWKPQSMWFVPSLLPVKGDD